MPFGTAGGGQTVRGCNTFEMASLKPLKGIV